MSTQPQPSPRRQRGIGTPTHVSEPAFEFLLYAIIEQVESECKKAHDAKMKKKQKQNDNEDDDDGNKENTNDDEEDKTRTIEEDTNGSQNSSSEEEEQKQLILMNENIAAKMEQMGFEVGYRLVERLAQPKSLVPPTAHANTPTQASLQLEAVKFICKEFWTEVFSKQIDKLQTNHRGVFVLKDGSFKWLDRMPVEDMELANTMAIKILALPCGLIRGALSNLGIVAAVSCDFMDDGEHMRSCSFNVKIK